MRQNQTQIFNNYTRMHNVNRSLNKLNAAIVLNPQRTKRNSKGKTELLKNVHSLATYDECIEYLHELINYFGLNQDIIASIKWQLRIIFERGYILNFFHNTRYESITLASLMCAYQLSKFNIDEAQVVPYIKKAFKPEVRDAIVTETNKSYVTLCELHEIPENDILLMQFSRHFNNKDTIPTLACH